MSKQTQNKKAGLYYRLSQEDERAGESLSIENQKKILEKYARENGFEIIGFDLYSYSNSDPERHEVRIEMGKKLNN